MNEPYAQCTHVIEPKNLKLTKSGYTGSEKMQSSSSEGSSLITDESISAALYLKPTQAGFDSWFAIDRYPTYDDSGSNELYEYITYLEMRITSSHVTDESSFDTAWTAAPSEYSIGSTSNYTTSYSSTVGVGTYVHTTPTKTSGSFYQQLITIHFVNNLNNDDSTYKHEIKGWTDQTYLGILSDPTVSFSQTTNDFTVADTYGGSRRVIEFNRNSYTPYSAYLTSEETDICYNCAVRDQEFGVYYGQTQAAFVFTLWPTGTHEVKLSYASAHPSGTRTRFSDALDNWISEMNAAISGSDVSFTRNDSASSPAMLVETKSNTDMGSSGGTIIGGLWQNETNSYGFINYAYIRINYETEYYDDIWSSVEGVMIEECTQACGAGGKNFSNIYWKSYIAPSIK